MATDNLRSIDMTVIDEVEALLKDTKDKLPSVSAQRLQLAISQQTAKAVNQIVEHLRIQNGKVISHEYKLQELESKNILIWAKKNPKTAGAFLFSFLVLFSQVERVLIEVDPLEILRKLIGL